MKTCAKCGETKSDTEFSKQTSARDGLQSRCKACERAAYAKWNAANREKSSARMAKWRAANPERAKEIKATWRANNPDSDKAYAAANQEKCKASSAAYRAANRDMCMARSAAWAVVNPDKVKAKTYKWRAANAGKVRAAKSAWRAANPEAVRIHKQNRRARKLENGGKLSNGLADKLFKLQKGKCACGCKQPLGDDYHLDHRMPLKLGGSNTDDNIQLLRAQCNMQKAAKHPVDFMRQRGFLL